MSGNVGASMEFTARVESILRGLLPRRWITESGRQRLGGLFECLLQKAGVPPPPPPPPPTFYAATLSVCSGNRLASPTCIRIALKIGPPSSPVAEYRNTSTRFSSQLFHPIGRFHWKFPRENRLEFLEFRASFLRTLGQRKSIRSDSPKIPLSRCNGAN